MFFLPLYGIEHPFNKVHLSDPSRQVGAPEIIATEEDAPDRLVQDNMFGAAVFPEDAFP
jgi:hypothetical protein